MSNDIRHGMIVYPHVAGWDATPIDDRIAAAVATVVSLTPSELAEFARHLVAASELQASWLIDALIIKLEVEPSAERHERIAAAILAGAGALE